MGAERRWEEGWGKGPLRWPPPSMRMDCRVRAMQTSCSERAVTSRVAGRRAAPQRLPLPAAGDRAFSPVPSFGCQGSCGAAHPISLAAPCSEGTKRIAECIDGDSHVLHQKTAASITKSAGSTPAPAPPHPPPRSWVRGLGHDVRT